MKKTNYPPQKNKNNNAGDEHSPENLLLKTELKRFGWFFWGSVAKTRQLSVPVDSKIKPPKQESEGVLASLLLSEVSLVSFTHRKWRNSSIKYSWQELGEWLRWSKPVSENTVVELINWHRKGWKWGRRGCWIISDCYPCSDYIDTLKLENGNTSKQQKSNLVQY